MQEIKKRQQRLYTEECQSTPKQKIASRLTTAASLSFSQSSGTFQLNSPVRRVQFFGSPRYAAGQQQYYVTHGDFYRIQSTMVINQEVDRIDTGQLLQTMKMIYFLVVKNSEQRRYIKAMSQSNLKLRRQMEEKQYRVQQDKLKLQTAKASLQRKKQRQQLIRQKKEILLNQDIAEMTVSIRKMQKKLSQTNDNSARRNLKSRQITQVGNILNSRPCASNQLYWPVGNYNPHLAYPPNAKYYNKPNRLPFFAENNQDYDKQIYRAISTRQQTKQSKYFDRVQDSPNANQCREGATSHNKIRDSANSSKWRNHDDEDQQLVELLSNSLKKMQEQPNRSFTKPVQFNQQQAGGRKQSNAKEFQTVSFNEESSSVVNITYESSDKRHSKSQESKQETLELIYQKNKKKQITNINQSPIKIELELSQSRESFKNDAFKTNGLFGKLQSCAQQKKYPINEQLSELAFSLDQQSGKLLTNNNKNSAKPASGSGKDKLVFQDKQNPLKNPPNLLQVGSLSQSVQVQQGELQKQRRKTLKKDQMPHSTAQSDQDILDSINLLHHSKISREKANKILETQLKQSQSSSNKVKEEQESLEQTNFAEEIGPLKISSVVLQKHSGSAIQKMRNRSITAMNRLSIKSFNESVSLPIQQQEGEDEKIGYL